MPGLRSLVARRKYTVPTSEEAELSHKISNINTFVTDTLENGNDDKISSNFCLNNILSSTDLDDIQSKLIDDLCDEELSPITESQINEGDLSDEQKVIEEKVIVKMKLLHETAINSQNTAAFYETSDETYLGNNLGNGMNLDYLKTNLNIEDNIVAEACQSNREIKIESIKMKTEDCIDIDRSYEKSTSQDCLYQENGYERPSCSDTPNIVAVSNCTITNRNEPSHSVEKSEEKTIENSIYDTSNGKTTKIEEDRKSVNEHYLCDINPVETSACVMLSKNMSNPNSSQLKCPNCLNSYNSKSTVTFSMCQNTIRFDCTNCDWIVVRKACMSR